MFLFIKKHEYKPNYWTQQAAKDVGLASNDRITALSAKISSSLAAHPDKRESLDFVTSYYKHIQHMFAADFQDKTAFDWFAI